MMSSPTRWRKNCSDITTALSPSRIGCVAETGTFDELMAKKGYFYALYTVTH
ncbi:MAG: hypothetical protein ACLR07_01485 [Christensenellales bacterium]